MTNKQDQKYKVLCYAGNDSGRDVELMLPLRYFAETYLNCRFIHKTAFDVFAVFRFQPDIVFVPNTVGDHFYAEIAQYAHRQNIKVFALSSEGNFHTDGTFNYWGVNQFKAFVQEYVCMWNQRTTTFLKKAQPDDADKIVLTGGTGFDRYKIYQFLSRQEFLKKKEKSGYKKVVGYASWGVFGKLHHTEGLAFLKELYKNDEHKLRWLEEQRQYVEAVLKELIEKNQDILFVLKRHPTETHSHIQNREVLNDIINLQKYNNVVYVRDDENIHDLINVSDVWLGFESTTVMESWMLEKHTIFINKDVNYKRKQYYKGCTIATDYEQLQQYLDEFYQKGYIADFMSEEKQKKRQLIMEDVFGFTDGLNHVRAGYYFKKTLTKAIHDRSLKKRRFSVKYFAMYAAMFLGKYLYRQSLFIKVKKLSKTIWVFETYKQKKVAQLYARYFPFLKQFHIQHQIPELVKKNEIKSILANSYQRHTKA